MSSTDSVHSLRVTVVSASNLKDTQTFGKQDPYIVVKIKNEEHKTEVHEDGHDEGHFDETFIFNNLSASFIQGANGTMLLKAMNKNLTDRYFSR